LGITKNRFFEVYFWSYKLLVVSCLLGLVEVMDLA
jgi:hypothetical protein